MQPSKWTKSKYIKKEEPVVSMHVNVLKENNFDYIILESNNLYLNERQNIYSLYNCTMLGQFAFRNLNY